MLRCLCSSSALWPFPSPKKVTGLDLLGTQGIILNIFLLLGLHGTHTGMTNNARKACRLETLFGALGIYHMAPEIKWMHSKKQLPPSKQCSRTHAYTCVTLAFQPLVFHEAFPQTCRRKCYLSRWQTNAYPFYTRPPMWKIIAVLVLF